MKKFFLLLCLIFLPSFITAQRVMDRNNRKLPMGTNINEQGFGNEDTENENGFQRNSSDNKNENKKKTPIGLRTWTADIFNETDSIVPDTTGYQFQNTNFTEGITGRYNTLGNMGSPRISRIFSDRPSFNYFIFTQPYDFFIRPFDSFHFTNTLSPFTNITYHETTDSDNGEDRITAKYAVNANKDMGFGFNIDYLYGRGYYDHQANSQFGTTLYGSIIKEKYKAHFRIFSNYLKTSENGGITDDEYISNPQNFPSKFSSNDIPTNLNKVWNKMYVNGVDLTHSYSIGFYRTMNQPDSSSLYPQDSIHHIAQIKTANDSSHVDSAQSFKRKLQLQTAHRLSQKKYSSPSPNSSIT